MIEFEPIIGKTLDGKPSRIERDLVKFEGRTVGYMIRGVIKWQLEVPEAVKAIAEAKGHEWWSSNRSKRGSGKAGVVIGGSR